METEFKRDLCGAEDLLQSFPLHRACRDGDLCALAGLLGEAVMSVCDASIQDPLFGWTPAHWAAHNGKVECLEMLVKAGLPCDIATHGTGLTLAHVAALEGQMACLTWLTRNGISINAQDHMGETAAHKAVRCGSVECLHILRQHGADLSLRSSIGATVMDLAIQNQQSRCIEYFSAGGDSHLTNHMTDHMTCMNGRRKRMQPGEESEPDMDSAKRPKVENEHEHPPSSLMCNPMTSLGVGTCSTVAGHHIQNGVNGTYSNGGSVNGSKELDQELAQDYGTVVPCCQPVYSRKPMQSGYEESSSIEMVTEESSEYRNAHGVNGYSENDDRRAVRLSENCIHTMSTGVMEHNAMVEQSVGYDTTLETMYNSYDSYLCGHAY
ncbi:ankyrin repeat domain-containing protein 10-like isoform X1 [Lytechinus variegatus]|uniref:ankyrin repeat domain-containing protein 10-like isoform X1 n=1 Tax=Lytechinus variegatus TaxID=7654 RepID=UPI001BB1230D|nr:ankyrin repeat domain-containing protein 10-like isoform X1 [Lytechinus variegatus]